MCQLLGIQPGGDSSSQQQHNPLRYDLTELSGAQQHASHKSYCMIEAYARNIGGLHIGVCQKQLAAVPGSCRLHYALCWLTWL
jgi:hypothetical protein